LLEGPRQRLSLAKQMVGGSAKARDPVMAIAMPFPLARQEDVDDR
jgi:hypothetical protein